MPSVLRGISGPVREALSAITCEKRGVPSLASRKRCDLKTRKRCDFFSAAQKIASDFSAISSAIFSRFSGDFLRFLRQNLSSSIFYRIIRAGIGVFCLWGLTKVMFMSNISDTNTPSLPPTPQGNTQKSRRYTTLCDTILHDFV